ncbi:hypothetical protein Kpol_526p48 [Vanderwaltozyma polyspora DSM 70294]|uniref:DUF3533 domain-containing protein n=1 Tax=Vanderwaltozyma polyspora (strain ATCC 22028 / DSM 70294 / BCRC 21397 / CBS 2163 / NBRC 10782 / NRRL Y-8283 / UCD 57-17) TaxID=436907 RepID=A7TLV3_VANPO|nr:uncharacterized protein Kpol_526p48 [Vanderwaltozyma polyspora DSM 70294]EDO16795.1 hypothetical protein Kpol_526p48 [Vanderwaltozyma polyspora DSM 70294]
MKESNATVEPPSDSYDEVNSLNLNKEYISKDDSGENVDNERLQNDEPPRVNFWDHSLKDLRFELCKGFLINLFLLGCMCFTVLCIYWGASYHRNKFIHKVHLIALFQDEDGQSPLSQLGYSVLKNYTSVIKGTWTVYNQSEFIEHYNLPNSTVVNEELFKIIHHEDYWFSVNIKENATQALINSLSNNNTQLFNASQFFEVGFESGRDPTNLRSAILPLAQAFESVYKRIYLSSLLPSIVNSTTSSNDPPSTEKLISASSLAFTYSDYRPFVDAVDLAPLQVGAIYTIILTIVQFALWGKTHGAFSQKLKIPQLIVYRIVVSVITLFFLSLFYCTISAVYKVKFTRTFGRGGFMVYWMSTWLVMLAVGGASENMVGLIIAYGAQYIAFWILTWIILNISVTFFPLALDSSFYRFGYAMPVHNAVDIYKTIFLDLSKHKMGRNYGILCAWVALNWILMPLFMKLTGAKMKKNAQQQMEASLKMAKAKGII